MVRIAIDAMGGDLGAKAMVKGAVESLKEEGMKLNLVNSRDDLHILTKIREHKRIEVRYADGLRQSFFICFCDPSVCSEIIS